MYVETSTGEGAAHEYLLGRALGARTVGKLVPKRPANSDVYLHHFRVAVRWACGGLPLRGWGKGSRRQAGLLRDVVGCGKRFTRRRSGNRGLETLRRHLDAS